MLRLYTRQADQLVPLENLPTDMHSVSCLWLDLITPTPEEDGSRSISACRSPRAMRWRRSSYRPASTRRTARNS